MDRTQIYLSREQRDALDRVARRTGQTRSDLIREAIDRIYRGTSASAGLVAALEASAGAWSREETGAEVVERLRPGRLARLHETDRP